MIYGINPYTISSIKYQEFYRYGPHPSWTKLMFKKNPIRGILGFYTPGLFDGVYLPYVIIIGANGRHLKHIVCRSNDEAKELCNKLNDQLAEFIKKTEK